MATQKTITEAEWMAELVRLSKRNDEGMTCEELAKATGVSTATMRKRIKEATARGWVVTGRRTITRIDGVAAMAPVYRIVKPAAKR